MLQTLNHDNIIGIYDSWEDEKNKEVVFITELMTSGTLKEFVSISLYFLFLTLAATLLVCTSIILCVCVCVSVCTSMILCKSVHVCVHWCPKNVRGSFEEDA